MSILSWHRAILAAVLLSLSLIEGVPARSSHDYIGLPLPDAGTAGGIGEPSSQGRAWSPDYLQYDGGCIDLTSAAGVNRALADGIGPLISFDAPRAVDLEDGQLWFVQDAYLDFPEDGPATSLRAAQYAGNAVLFVDDDGCATILIRPSNPNERVSFEYGTGDVTLDRFFWPLGGEVHGDEIVVYWASMVRSAENPTQYDGIVRHTDGTHIARYDSRSLERLSFEPAIEPGVDPQWGFEVVTSDDWTYLFGNDNVLNLARVGGLGAGPHPSTDMFVARIPAGAFDGAPAYWDGETWVDGPSDAAPISTRGYVSNQMHPRRFGDLLVSVTTLDEYWGDELVVDVARSPEGPWTEAARIGLDRDGPHDLVSYHPLVLAPTDDGTLIVLVSYNAADWFTAIDQPALYRPHALEIEWDQLEAAAGAAEPRS